MLKDLENNFEQTKTLFYLIRKEHNLNENSKFKIKVLFLQNQMNITIYWANLTKVSSEVFKTQKCVH